MKLNRRTFLRYAAGAGIAAGLGGPRALLGDVRPRAAGPPPAGNPLRMPTVHTGGTISAAKAQIAVWPGSPVELWTYDGVYPSPTFRVQSGDDVELTFTNNLTEPSNIHWHGLIVPAEMDGHPRDAVAPGGTFRYAFTVNQRAGAYWYHPHPHMRTAAQVYGGMAGFFIVEDEEERALGLPSGEYEIPLLLQDRRVETDRSFTYAPTDADMATGYLGDTVIVNGTPDAVLDVARDVYRFRVLNGSNARILDLALSDSSAFHVIGTDGGLLDKPYDVQHSMMAPAERLDILIDFSRYQIGGTVTLTSRNFEGGSGRQQGAEMTILRFNIVRDGAPTPIPTTLVPLERWDPAQAVRTREFVLRTDHSTGMQHMINNRTFSMERVDETVRRGDLEIWTFANPTQEAHPMHVHGTQFQVLDFNENPEVEPKDLGWKDTVNVPAFTTVRVLTRFSPYTGLYMAHCHNLEHEDGGMMTNVEIVSDSAVEQDPGAAPDRMDLR